MLLTASCSLPEEELAALRHIIKERNSEKLECSKANEWFCCMLAWCKVFSSKEPKPFIKVVEIGPVLTATEKGSGVRHHAQHCGHVHHNPFLSYSHSCSNFLIRIGWCDFGSKDWNFCINESSTGLLMRNIPEPFKRNIQLCMVIRIGCVMKQTFSRK